MRHLNYGHLLYFWTVAREGSIARAAEVLHLTPQTISGQIRTLEESIGEELFRRSGRRLVLSEMGKLVFEYAEDIFTTGAELADVVRSKVPRGPLVFTVGVTDVVPKLVASRVLEPALALEEPVRVVCLEGKLEALLAELAVHRLDMVLSDRPAPDGLNIRAYSHSLGVSAISFFCAGADLARRLRRRFPTSLHEAPMLLPTGNTALRRSLDHWFDDHKLVPHVVGEFEDSALLKAFGRSGRGIFPGPTAIEAAIKTPYRAAAAISEAARTALFVAE